jgi:hypothetical protein
MSNRQTKRLKSHANMLLRHNAKQTNGLARRPGVKVMSLVTNCNTISAYEKVALFNLNKPERRRIKTSMGWMYL